MMRLPRRVPWANTSELEQIFTWIYPNSEDIASTQRAVNRLLAWAQAAPLPQALDGALGVLSARVLDMNAGSTSALVKRHAYAAALVRFVNGLVDPLQLGAFARPIASLAQQLDLPSWLVELRHASTHEDLPSLEVLREGARQSLAWLHDRYFLPTIYPFISTPLIPSLRPLSPLLNQYKGLQKQLLSDTSLIKTRGTDAAAIYRDIERWFGEAKVVATAVSSEGVFGSGSSRRRQETGFEPENEEGAAIENSHRERWALGQVADALCERGALVPTSKKKRIASDGAMIIPKGLLALWAPLLEQLRARHPAISVMLVQTITTRLVGTPAPDENGIPGKVDPSYEHCLAAWAAWMVDTWSQDDVSRADTVAWLLRGLGSVTTQRESGSAARKLLSTLSSGHAELKTMVASLEPVIGRSEMSDRPGWTDDALSTMDKRLQSVADALVEKKPEPDDDAETMNVDSPPADLSISLPEYEQLPPGWTMLSVEKGWQPAPMGVFVRCS